MESYYEVNKSRKRRCNAIESEQLQEESGAMEYYQIRAGQKRDQSTSGFQSRLDKLYQEGELSTNDKKVVWAGMRREMDALVNQVMKFHAACGGSMFLMYAPPMALADKRAMDDPNMFRAFRFLRLNTDASEMHTLVNPALVQQLEQNFTKCRYKFFKSSTEPAASMPLPSVGSSSAAASSSTATSSSAVASSSTAASSSVAAPVVAEHIPLTEFSDILNTSIGDGNNTGEYSTFDDLDDIQPDVVAAEAPGPDPAPAPAPAPVPVAVAVAVEAPVPAGKKGKKLRKLTGPVQILTEEECVKASRIRGLFWTDDGMNVLQIPCPKPHWMTYERYAGPTETSVKSIIPPGTINFSNCDNSLRSFLDKGYYKNAGLTDLSNFVKWFKDNSSTMEARAELKAKLGGYLAGCLFPIINRWLFHYAAKHGGDEGDENARMERVIKAFKDVVNPPEA